MSKHRFSPSRALIESLEVRRFLHAGHEHPAVEVNVNFQTEATADAPAGYIADIGRAFGRRANGRFYGWSTPNEAQTRERNLLDDQRYDTLTHFASQSWEIAVPNGTYAVRLVAGDQAAIDSVYRINVESVLAVDGTPTSGNRFIEGTTIVTVSDGRLTLSSAAGSSNNKIAFLQIQSVDPEPPLLGITAPDSSAGETGLNHGKFLVTRSGGDVSQPLVVRFAVGGTAINGVDYGVAGDAFTMPAGTTTFEMTLRAIPDALAEPTETMTITLLDVGTYEIEPAAAMATVTIADGGSSPAEVFKARVNFQPYDVPVPGGYVVDGGAVYGRRANGLIYGWNTDKTDSPVDRNSAAAPDQRYDTLAPMAVADSWAIAVPNGTYEVRVVAGDPDRSDGYYSIDIEGVSAIDHEPTSARRFIEETRLVAVLDGALTVTSGAGADGNKLMFIELERLPGPVGPPAAPRALAATANSSSSARLTWLDYATDEVGFRIERKTGVNGAWQRIATVPADTIEYQDSGLAASTRYDYRVRAFNAKGNSAYTTNGTTTFTPFPSNISWERVASSPVERAESLGGVFNDKLYVFGGLATFGEEIRGTTRSDVYDPATDTWSRIADMPEKVTHAGTVLVGDTFWFVGGYFGDHPGPGGDHVWKYDVGTNSWSRGPDLPRNRGAGSAVLINNRIYFVGGLDETRGPDHDDMWVLDLGNQSAGWRRRASLPDARNHTSAVALGGYMYVLGGQKDEEELQDPLASVYRYDPEDDDWDRMANLPEPRSHTNASTFVMNGRIIVLGGEDGFGLVNRTVYAYHPPSNSWSRMTDLPAARSTSVAGVLSGNRIISATGNSPIASTTTWIGRVT